MEKTIAELLAYEAKTMSYADLPAEVVHEVKRAMLDTLGCALAGYSSQASQIIQSAVEEMGGPDESTIFGSGRKTSCLNATLANGIMIRHLDYTSLAYRTKEARDTMGHHGEAIAPILAVGERQHSSGQDIILAIALAFEFLTRIVDSVPRYNELLDDRGYVHETMRTPAVMALVAGKLLGLSDAQMAHALSVACGFNLELGIMYWCEEEVTMARNLRFPMGAYNGILGAFLARKGFKGPLNVFEGHHGLAEVVTGGQMDLDKLRKPWKDWTILNTWIKSTSVSGYMQGFIEATITLAKEHDIKAANVKSIKITTTPRAAQLMANPESRQYPKNSYTADHSAYYTTAVSLMDRTVGPDQYSEDKLRDPKLRELTEKVTIASDPGLSNYHAPGISEITTTNGQTFKCQVLESKGHPKNPMSDAEIEEKFKSLVGKLVEERRMKEIIEAIYRLDKLADIGDFAKLLTFKRQS